MSRFDHRTSDEYRELVKQLGKPIGHAHVGSNELREMFPVLERLPELSFPINSAGELLDALGRAGELTIVGLRVDPALMIKHMPAYYFPIANYDNFVEKIAELVRAHRRKIDPTVHTEILRRRLPRLHFPIVSAEQLADSVAGLERFPLGDRMVTTKEALRLLPTGFFPVRDQEDFERKTLRFVNSRPLIEPE